VPTEHAKQVVVPVVSIYVPGKHLVHELAAGRAEDVENVPCRHGRHVLEVVAPILDEYEPLKQEIQVADDVAARLVE
jgi:hypothetical protein